MGLEKKLNPDEANFIAGVSCVLCFVSTAIVGLASSKGRIGTVVLAGALAAALYWALTTHREKVIQSVEGRLAHFAQRER